MVPNESEEGYLFRFSGLHGFRISSLKWRLVFACQAVTAEKKEDGHSVVPKVTKKIQDDVGSAVCKIVCQLVDALEIESVFVLSYTIWQPVHVVVGYNEQYAHPLEQCDDLSGHYGVGLLLLDDVIICD